VCKRGKRSGGKTFVTRLDWSGKIFEDGFAHKRGKSIWEMAVGEVLAMVPGTARRQLAKREELFCTPRFQRGGGGYTDQRKG